MIRRVIDYRFEHSAACPLLLLHHKNLTLSLYLCLQRKMGVFDHRARPRSPSLLSPVSPVVRVATSRIAAKRDINERVLEFRVLADPAHNDRIRDDRVHGGQ